ncbi:MAG: ATP-binding protein, partial [Brachymonas sp.]|nr:ATP-binding protein [Brachymonas sp.]
LGLVVSNQMENDRRSGKSPCTEATELSIVARAEGANMVHLQIHDHGSGVPPAILSRLTQPFFRADEARPEAVGSGLGLAIVKKVVEHLGGSLKLSNRAEGGLMADVHLPRVK